MKYWKRRLLSAAAALVMAVTLAAPAAAAGEKPIPPLSIELNGASLETEARPRLVNGSTYVPARALLEALGAQVEWDKSTRTVTASRDGCSVAFAIGAETASLTEADGTVFTVPMDSPAFLSGGSTYIPVRFVAESFGCLVGWDSANRTVLIADLEELTAQAMEKYPYTLLEKLSGYLSEFGGGEAALSGTLEGGIALGRMELASLSGALSGLRSERAAEASLSWDGDFSGLEHLFALMDSPLPAEDLPLTSGSIELRVDSDSGRYFVRSPLLSDRMELPADAWVMVNSTPLPLSDQQLTYTPDSFLLSALSQADIPFDREGVSFQALTAALDSVAARFSDTSFHPVEGGYTVELPMPGELDCTGTYNLRTDSSGAITGCTISFSYRNDLSSSMYDEDSALALALLGIDLSQFSVQVEAGISGRDSLSATVRFSAGDGFSAHLSYLLKTAATTRSAQAKPDAGSTVYVFPHEQGEKSVLITVVDRDGTSWHFSCRTDAGMLDTLLLDYGIAEGEVGAYGLYITTVNGYTADADAQEWWCITKGGESLMTGASSTPVADGDRFELTLTTGW